MPRHSIPNQLSRHIKQFVHTGNLDDIERTLLAVHNLLTRNQKFKLDFDAPEDLTFSFLPKNVTLGNETFNATKIELKFEPQIPLSTSLISRAYPFQDQTPSEIRKQKIWIVIFLYDLLQQFGVDLEMNEKLLRDSQANVTPRALAQLLKKHHHVDKTDPPRWYKEMKKLLPILRAGMTD